MSESALPPSTVVLPPLPQQADEFLRSVFAPPAAADAGTELPAAAVVQQAASYSAYVRQLALGLLAESTRLAAMTQDEQALERVAKDLLQIEARRRETLGPYLQALEESGQARNLPTAWSALQDRVRSDMAAELEAIRDARLRLDFRRGDLINQRKGSNVRIVLRGASQITLHFGQRRGDAASPD